MKTKVIPVTGQELEDVINGLSMSGRAKEALLAACNRADLSEEPQQLERTCKEVTRGSLDEAIMKQGVEALALLLQRQIEITATHLIIHPHQMPEEQPEEEQEQA